VVLLIEALRRQGIRFVLTRHEATAAFMAGGQGELTGTPGICVGTLGPGATNLVTGVASALLERAPVVALTGALSRSAPQGTTHQAVDLNALFRTVAKRSDEISPATAFDVTAASFAIAGAARQGPTHLSLPADFASQAAEPSTASSRPPDEPVVPELRTALELIAGAARPAIVVGLDAVAAGASDAVRALAAKLRAPVATLPKSKGLFPEDHPDFAGTLEMAGDDLVVEYLRAADLILMIGVDVVEFDKPWRLSAPIVDIRGMADTEGYYPTEVDLVGPIRDIVRHLADDVPSREPWAESALEQHRADLAAHIRPTGAAVQPWQVVDALRERMPRQTIATSDVGAHKMIVGQAWATYEAREFFMANGLSSMGYSIPVAASVQLLRPDQPVVAFVGDGGFGMYLGELETLVRIGSQVLIVVLVDDSLEMIRRVQDRHQVANEGTAIGNPDYASLGKAFGIEAVEVETNPELIRAVDDLAGKPGVRIVAAHVDRTGYQF
jgi:acetolactate synthase-1/2/3 large subunit